MFGVESGFSDALNESTAQEFLFIVEVKSNKSTSAYGALSFYFSTRDLYLSDSSLDVHGLLVKPPVISENLNIINHKASIGGFSISIIDTAFVLSGYRSSKFSGFLDDYNIYNREVNVFLWIDGVTDIDDCVKIYSGLASGFKIDNDIISISVENSTSTVHKSLPQSIITPSDKQGTAPIPADSLGKFKPIVYGDHTFNFVHTTRTTCTFDQSNSLVPMVYLGLDDDNKKRWIISHHQLDSIGKMWAFDSALGRYVELRTYTTVSNSASGAIIKHDFGEYFYDYWFGSGDFTDILGQDDTSNVERISDQLASTSATINHEFDASTNERQDQQYFAYNPSISDDDIIEVAVFAFTSIQTSGSPTYTINSIDLSGIGVTATLQACGTQAATVAGASSNVRWDTVGACIISISQIFKRLKYLPTSHLPLFAECKGREASSTVAGHFSGLSTGDLLERPAQIADSIIYDELGQTVDTTSFQAVDTELASWKMNMVLNSQVSSQKILEKLAFQSKSFIYYNDVNKISMDTFFASDSTDFDDIRLDDVELDTLKIKKTSLRELVNDIILNYRKQGTGSLQEVIERVNNASNTGSIDQYNATQEKTIDADYIADTTTAGLLADHWVQTGSYQSGAFWTTLRDVIEFKTSNLLGESSATKFFRAEITDVFEFDHSVWDDQQLCNGVSWSGKKFKIISVTRGLDGLKIKGVEL
jgi:hypothetical protein